MNNIDNLNDTLRRIKMNENKPKIKFNILLFTIIYIIIFKIIMKHAINIDIK